MHPSPLDAQPHVRDTFLLGVSFCGVGPVLPDGHVGSEFLLAWLVRACFVVGFAGDQDRDRDTRTQLART
jgi:hypothetical protein